MSMMLTFAEAAWVQARSLAMAGRRGPALQALAPLLNSAPIPPRLQLLALRLAGRLHAAAGRYRVARRLLRQAATLDPQNAEIHFEIGQAFESDPAGCDRRAARRFAVAVRLAPTQPRFRAALGRARVRCGRVRTGVADLRQAAQDAPANAAVLRVVLEGLTEAGRPLEAAATVRRSRFVPGTAMARLVAEARFRQAAGSRRVPPRRGPVLRLAGGQVRADLGHRPRGPRFADLD